jgi:hypothetical protein
MNTKSDCTTPGYVRRDVRRFHAYVAELESGVSVAALPGQRGAWVELDELYHRIDDWAVAAGNPALLAALLEYEAWRLEFDAGRGALVTTGGERCKVDDLFEPAAVLKRRRAIRSAGRGRRGKGVQR